jgi:hypothetical protein
MNAAPLHFRPPRFFNLFPFVTVRVKPEADQKQEHKWHQKSSIKSGEQSLEDQVNRFKGFIR